MKSFGKITVCLAVNLALGAGLRAETVPMTGNPYAPVVARNIFGLLPPPPPVDPNAVAIQPPVKITLNGIMNVFGQVQAFYKAAGKTPGKEDAYMLAAGQGQDDIEVVKIDEKNGAVTFNNHGVQQVIPLAAAPAGSAPTAVGANPGATGIPGIPRVVPGRNNFGSSGFNNTFGGRSAAGGGIPNGSSPNNDGAYSVPTRSSSFIQQPQTSLTPEEQTVAIEVNREATKQKVLQGDLPPLPPTEITPDDATGPGGGPLVTPAPGAPPQ
ncbi:MAG TPA: hypothetical protein VH251_03390 [Verrucomicrobiae bacterium]|jgi:hypothetical protein|nr:hypothetical protein [Verrucomicrobiae bacterium]